MGEEKGRPVEAEARLALIREIEEYFAGRVGSTTTPPAAPGGELRLATAVLLLEMGRADLDARHDEHRAVARALAGLLGVGAYEALRAIRQAEEERGLALPLHHFTGLVDRHFTREEKRRLVQCLWQIAFADAELKAHEEYLVRKIAEQIHLPFEDFLLAKIDAREQFLDRGAGS